MANSANQAGLEARQRHGIIRSHRWLLLRRLSQLAVLMMFLSGPWWGIWILKGNYSGSLLLETVPLTDPLMMLESVFAGHWPALTLLDIGHCGGLFPDSQPRVLCMGLSVKSGH